MSSEPNDLFALMYSSYATGAVDATTLDHILEVARANNEKLGITGILLYRQGRFFQYLEGAEHKVKALYESICHDTRHDQLRVLMQQPLAARRFSEWSMGYEPLRQSTEPPPPGFRSTFVDLEDTNNPEHVLRAVTELAYWYRVRAARLAPAADA